MKRLQGSNEAKETEAESLSNEVAAEYKNPTNTAYLREKLKYDGADRLVDEEQKGVMMSWESKLPLCISLGSFNIITDGISYFVAN
jgi:hypothetical protein